MRAGILLVYRGVRSPQDAANLIWHPWRWPYARIGELVRLVPRSGSLAAVPALIPAAAVRAGDMREAGLTAAVLA